MNNQATTKRLHDLLADLEIYNLSIDTIIGKIYSQGNFAILVWFSLDARG